MSAKKKLLVKLAGSESRIMINESDIISAIPNSDNTCTIWLGGHQFHRIDHNVEDLAKEANPITIGRGPKVFPNSQV